MLSFSQGVLLNCTCSSKHSQFIWETHKWIHYLHKKLVSNTKKKKEKQKAELWRNILLVGASWMLGKTFKRRHLTNGCELAKEWRQKDLLHFLKNQVKGTSAYQENTEAVIGLGHGQFYTSIVFYLRKSIWLMPNTVTVILALIARKTGSEYITSTCIILIYQHKLTDIF